MLVLKSMTLVSSGANIIEFEDYRDFLSEKFKELKKGSKKFSYEYCAGKIGTTKSYLKLLLEKKRHSSQDKIWKLAIFFNLTDFEKQYLVFLLLKAVSKEPQIKKYFSDILQSLNDRAIFSARNPSLGEPNTKTLIQIPQSSNNSKLLYKTWAHMAIAFCTKLVDFKNDSHWISERLGNKVTPEIVESILKELIKNDILKVQGDKLVQTEKFYQEPHFADPTEYRDYQSLIYRSIQATDDVNLHRTFCFQGLALALDMENERKLIDLYQQLYINCLALEKASQNPDVIIMVSNNVFTVTPDPKYLNQKKE